MVASLERSTSKNTVDVDIDRWFGPAEIPTLAIYGLHIVPGYRLLPNGEEDESWRPEWFAWRDKVMDVREEVWARAARDIYFQAEERNLCRDDVHYFKAMYGWITEPRQRKGEHKHKPFIPFHFQVHLTNIRRALLKEEDERDMWFPKARGLGVSWNNQWDEIHDWLFWESRWILASRNADLVGDIDNVDAMFGRVFYGLRRLPHYMLPRGFDPENPRGWWNSTKMLLTNKDKESPGYGSQMVGSPTTMNIGRAGRYTGADVDEAQEIPKLVKAITSLRGSTFHIMLTGTEGTNEGESWVEGWVSAKRANPSNVVELNFHQNAYQDYHWLERQYARAETEEEKAGIALEYERNYFAGYGDWIYPEAHTIQATDQPYDPRQKLCTIFDPGKDDETAALIAQPNGKGYHVLFTYEAKLTNMEWVCHVFTGIWPRRWQDDDGNWVQDSCYGMRPTPQEKKIGEFYYDRWMEGADEFWGMDPAGIATQSNTSFWSMFEEKTGELRAWKVNELRKEISFRDQMGEPIPDKNRWLPDPFGITLMYLALQKHRIQADRHYALRKFIPYITIQTGVESATRNKTCLTRYQFNPRSPKAVTESVPLHNQYSHLASCNEYLAIYIIYGFTDPEERGDVKTLRGPGQHRIPGVLALARGGPGKGWKPPAPPGKGFRGMAPPKRGPGWR